ncbi:MAG: TolC family protein [Planctomycetota bacterium]|nr:MAG: TolC family protein [Planctomycetota bacterium]
MKNPTTPFCSWNLFQKKVPNLQKRHGKPFLKKGFPLPTPSQKLLFSKSFFSKGFRTFQKILASLSLLTTMALCTSCSTPGRWQYHHFLTQEKLFFPEDKVQPEVAKKLRTKLTLAQVLQLVWQRNPSIKAARLRWRATIEKIPQATSYPDPILMYSYYVQEVETRVGPQRHSVSLTQKIPFPGKLTLQGKMASQDVRIARLITEKTIRNVFVQTKIAYYELLYIEKALKIYQKQRELLERYVNFAAGEHGKNNTKLSEVFKAQSLLAQSHYEILLLKEMRLAQQQRLRSLLALEANLELAPPQELSFQPFNVSLNELIQLGDRYNEELWIAREKVTKGAFALQLAKMSYLPNFQFGVKWIETGKAILSTPESGKDPLIVSAGLNLPIWWGRDAAKIDEKYYQLQALQQERTAVRQNLRSQISTAYFRLTNTERLVKLYAEQLLPQANQALVVAERRYREKVTNFSAMLETISVWLNFQLAYWRALVDYNQNLARLEQLIGQTIFLKKRRKP